MSDNGFVTALIDEKPLDPITVLDLSVIEHSSLLELMTIALLLPVLEHH
jgi:hypothetical protein